MTMSAGLAGMAGANELLGVTHLTTTSFATSVGFDSIAVALLARSNPIAIIPAAILFGAMRAGAGQMQIEARTPRELVDVLQAVILIVLVALPVLARAIAGRGSREFGAEAQQITRSYGSESVSS
jgi:simple sugar transport system permease protein